MNYVPPSYAHPRPVPVHEVPTADASVTFFENVGEGTWESPAIPRQASNLVIEVTVNAPYAGAGGIGPGPSTIDVQVLDGSFSGGLSACVDGNGTQTGLIVSTKFQVNAIMDRVALRITTVQGLQTSWTVRGTFTAAPRLITPTLADPYAVELSDGVALLGKPWLGTTWSTSPLTGRPVWTMPANVESAVWTSAANTAQNHSVIAAAGEFLYLVGGRVSWTGGSPAAGTKCGLGLAVFISGSLEEYLGDGTAPQGVQDLRLPQPIRAGTGTDGGLVGINVGAAGAGVVTKATLFYLRSPY